MSHHTTVGSGAPERPLCLRRDHVEMERRLERIERAIDLLFVALTILCWITASSLFGIAVYQFIVRQSGPMAGGGAALATLLYGGAAWGRHRVRIRREERRDTGIAH